MDLAFRGQRLGETLLFRALRAALDLSDKVGAFAVDLRAIDEESQAFARRTPLSQTGRVVDRIVARIEGDILLLSQVRELGAFQQLVEGHAESEDGLLQELIEQGIVEETSNPTIFQQAIGTGNDYDEELRQLVQALKPSSTTPSSWSDPSGATTGHRRRCRLPTARGPHCTPRETRCSASSCRPCRSRSSAA